MRHNLLVLGAVAAFGVAAVVAGVGDAGQAVACDHATKTAATTAGCCAHANSATTASVKKVHSATVRAAVVSPGTAPIMNIAAFAGMVASDDDGGCQWCSPEMCRTAAAAAAAGCPAFASTGGCSQTAAMSSGCGAHTASATQASGCPMSAKTVSTEGGCPHATSMTTASAAGCCAGKMTATTASSGCAAHANAAMAAGTCNHAMKASMAAGTCNHAMKASMPAQCQKGLDSAAIKAVSDEVPYAENKRVVLKGEYACSHCTLHATSVCAPMFKTADGKIYPLMKTARASALRKAGKSIEISTQVRKLDGVKYLEVKSYKTL